VHSSSDKKLEQKTVTGAALINSMSALFADSRISLELLYVNTGPAGRK